ncbi:MAG: hypothetical protein ACLGXA_17995 [Acidobacteriota bacterium]
MHPKKSILLYCADRKTLSATAFALRLHPYRVVATEDSMAAVFAAGDRCSVFACVLLIHEQQGDPAGRLLYRILESAAHLPVLLVDRAGDLAPVRYADIVLYGRNTSMQHILGALQMLCRKKPGRPASPGLSRCVGAPGSQPRGAA